MSGGPVRAPWPYPPGIGGTPPAPRQGRAGWLIGGGVAAVLVIALLVGSAFVVFGRSGSDATKRKQAEASRSAAADVQELARSATALSESPAARYTGTLVDDTGKSIPVEITITTEGSAKATLTIGAEKVEAIALADGLYLKASEAFWRREGAASDAVADFGQQWVKADSDIFGSDLNAALSPGTLARLLDPLEGEQPEVGAPEQINGVEVRPMRVDTLTAFVTTAEPHRIVRLTSDENPAAADLPSDPASGPPSGPPSAGTPSALTGRGLFARAGIAAKMPTGKPARVPARAPGATGFALDVAELTDAEVDTFFKELEEKVRGLKDSLDSRVRFSLAGQITLAPCTTNGCQANVTISNRVQTNSPYVSAQRPVTATVTIAMTLDGRPVNTCNNLVTMPPNGSVTTTCFAAYSIPPSRNPTTHFVEAKSRTVARALVQADVDRLVNDLTAEFARNRRGRGGAKPTTTATPSPTPTPTPTGGNKVTPVPTTSSDKECEAPPYLDAEGRNHVRLRHYAGGRQFRGPRRDSQWYNSVNLDQLARAAASVKGQYQPSTGRCVRELDASDFIGTRPPDIRTRQYTVVTELNGRVWTMHPGPRQRY